MARKWATSFTRSSTENMGKTRIRGRAAEEQAIHHPQNGDLFGTPDEKIQQYHAVVSP
jgi:hypothetical protein